MSTNSQPITAQTSSPQQVTTPNGRWALKPLFLTIMVLIACALAFGPTFIQAPPDLHDKAPQRALSVLVVCLALWITHAVPLTVTGLMAFALLPLLGICDAATAFSQLGNEAVFFMLGVFVLAAALISTGLSKRLTLGLLRRLDQGPRGLFTSILLTSSALALCMPEHAVAAMMFPIVSEIVEALRLRPRQSNYARLLFLAMAWGAVIGGVGTFLGGARAPLAITLYEAFYGHEAGFEQIGFATWMAACMPVVVLLTLMAWWLLPRQVPIDIDDIRSAKQMIEHHVSLLGKPSPKEKRLALLSVATIATWTLFGHSLGLATIALISACLLFVLRIVSWSHVQDYINWSILVMYGGAIAIGTALHDTAAMHWIVRSTGLTHLPPLVVLVIVGLIATALTECMSNAATVAALLPIGYSLCPQLDINPLAMTLCITVPAGLPFTFPVSSPPHAIAFSSGFYELKDAMKPGLFMTIVAITVFVCTMLFYWPAIGIELTTHG